MQAPPASNAPRTLAGAAAFLGVGLASQALYLFGCWFGANTFDPLRYLELTVLLGFVVSAGGSLYKVTQRMVEAQVAAGREAWVLVLPGEHRWPYRPEWVWIYLPGSIVELALVIPTSPDLERLIAVCGGGLLVVCLNSVWFLVLPTRIPEDFRAVAPRPGPSDAAVRRMWAHDGLHNAFPSGHCSLAVFVGLALVPAMGPWILVWPALVCVSCLFTRQHTLPDVVGGALWGMATHALFVGGLTAGG